MPSDLNVLAIMTTNIRLYARFATSTSSMRAASNLNENSFTIRSATFTTGIHTVFSFSSRPGSIPAIPASIITTITGVV